MGKNTDWKTYSQRHHAEGDAGALRPPLCLIGGASGIGRVMAPEECAARVLEGVAKNKAIISVTAHAKVFWVLHRYFPGLMRAGSRRMAARLRRERVEEGRT